jgi:ribonuclease J
VTDFTNRFTEEFPRGPVPGEPYVDIVPLGGLGEIGLNSMAVIQNDAILVLDAGLMFPGPEQPGVDLVIPDFSFLIENRKKVKGVVLTHGHEDHIGALPFLLRECPEFRVYGTKLTLALAELRLREWRVDFAKLFEINARDRLTLGPFNLEFIKVSHSILDGVGVAIETSAGIIVHTGDFKMDLSAPEKDRTDLFKFAEYGEMGVLALLSDSTNSDAPGHSVSEKEVGVALRQIFKKAKGRVIIACFASSLTRIREIAAAAEISRRKIVFDGRSMIGNVKLAQELGYLDLPPDIEISFQDVPLLRDREIVIVVTGSQGEPLSALSRMALGEHRQVIVRPGDTIIFSAKAIPGNETAINTLINLFHELGAEVLDPRIHQIHASGHGHIEELRLMLALTNPNFLVPIHGEIRHLNNHGKLANDLGIPEERVLLLKNGVRISFTPDKRYFQRKSVPTGRHLVEGNRLGSPGDPVLKSRRKLSEFGLVIAALVLDSLTMEMAAPPKVSILGVHYANEADLTYEAEQMVGKAAEEYARDYGRRRRISFLKEPGADLTEKVKGAVRSLFRQSINRKPMVHVQIILLDREIQEEEEEELFKREP